MAGETGATNPFNELHAQQASLDKLAKSVGNAMVGSVERQPASVVATPESMYGYPTAEQASLARERQVKATSEAARVEAIKILDKDAFKLGDLNPLIHPTDLTRTESADAVRYTVLRKIQEVGGLTPEVLGSTVVTDAESGKSDLRFVARFEVPSLTEHQLLSLEELVKDTYGLPVRTRTDNKGNKIPTQDYPPTQPGEEMKSKTGGWYMGIAPYPTSGLHEGLFVFKDYGPINKDNFLEESQAARKYIVEVREASQYQTDLVTFVTQVAAVLAQEKLPDRGQLLYETYYDLMRLGLKKQRMSQFMAWKTPPI